MISELDSSYIFETLEKINDIQLNFPRLKLEKIAELKQLDPTLEVFSKLVHIFSVEVSARIPEMKKFCECHDYENLSRVIHRFKSTTYNLGAARAVEITSHIEKVILRSGSPIELKQWIESLEVECLEAHQQLLKIN